MTSAPIEPAMSGLRRPHGLDSALAQKFLDENPDIARIEMMLVDLNGIIRGKWAPASTLPKQFANGMALPLSVHALDVWGREVNSTGLHIDTGDKDGTCWPIASSLARVPWAATPAAQLLVAMHDKDGTPSKVDPRHVLQRVVSTMATRGLHPVVAFELEFYLLEADSVTPRPIQASDIGPDRQLMYELRALEEIGAVLEDVRLAANLQNLPVDTLISEAGPGQFELNLVHRADAMRAADEAVLLRRLISSVARQHGLRASFMSKPFVDWPGNGMHVHVSLGDGQGNNLFAGDDGRRLHQQSIAGMLELMIESQALFINGYNGYRRLARNSYAPTRVIWGHDNRSVAVRVPAEGGKATRIEHRIAGADANPYLVLAAMLAGMLHGMDADLHPGNPAEGNADDGDAPRLTHDMGIALERFSHSKVLQETLGHEFCRVFNLVKLDEFLPFDQQITALEHQTYL